VHEQQGAMIQTRPTARMHTHELVNSAVHTQNNQLDDAHIAIIPRDIRNALRIPDDRCCLFMPAKHLGRLGMEKNGDSQRHKWIAHRPKRSSVGGLKSNITQI
jgi:hypothetical protein